MARSLEAGEIVPVGADAPPTLCDALQTPRVSPITFGILQRARGATALAVSDAEVARRDRAGPGASIGWWSSRAGRSRWRRCWRARSSRRRRRWSCCRAGMSIPRCTRGSSVRLRPRRSDIRRARGGRGSTARPRGSVPRARRRGSGARRRAPWGRVRRDWPRRRASVSSIIAMHGRIVSSIRSNASSRRACCCSIVAMARDDGADTG